MGSDRLERRNDVGLQCQMRKGIADNEVGSTPGPNAVSQLAN